MKQAIHFLLITLGLLAGAPAVLGQTISSPAPADTTRPNNSAPATGVKVGGSVLTPIDGSASTAATDTQRVSAKQQAQIRKIIPKQATIRSALVPGLGQIYNRQYWKLPIIYGGLATAIYFFYDNQRNYNLFVAGYREAFNVQSTDPRQKVAVVNGREYNVQQLKRITDVYRSQRDLTIILTAVGWALNAVEANVAAHLKTFDLSDELSMQAQPIILPNPGAGFVPGVRVTMTFK